MNAPARRHAVALALACLAWLASALPLAATPRVRLISTGGTIANARVGRLPPDDLVRSMPDSRALGVTVETEAFANASSTSLSLDDWVRLSQRIAGLLETDRGLAGVVVTSGTDTLEELAWFLHLSVRDARPVVVVGAMRSPDSPGADGPGNLSDALRVAAAPAASGRGTLVVMHGQVHAAVEVRKHHATDVGAFDSPAAAGVVTRAGVHFRRPARPRPPPGILAVDAVASLPRVDVLLTYQGAPGDLVTAAVQAGARGLVLASAGAGSLTPAQADAARRVAAEIPVVISSRTGAGPVRASPPDVTAWLSAGDIPPLKARILLMLGIARGLERSQIAAVFDQASAPRRLN